MAVLQSDSIDKKLVEVADMGRMSEIRRIAFFTHTGGYATHKIKGLVRALSDRFDLPDIIMSILIRSSHNVYFFDESEEEVLRQLSEIKAKKKGVTARKVLVRMIHDRFAKLHKQVLQEQQWSAQYRKGDLIPQLSRELMFASINDTHVLKGHFNSSNMHLRDMAKEFANTLDREDMTPEIIEEGWNLFEVSGIMNS